MNKIRFFLICLIPLQWIVIIWVSKNPEWIETYYSERFYTFIYKSHKFFFENLTFSFGDVLYGLSLLTIILSVIQSIKKRKKFFKSFLKNGLAIISFISLVFYLSWGLNYYRLPLHKTLNYSSIYNENQLTNTFQKLIEISNSLHQNLSEADSLALQIPYSKQKLLEMIEKNFFFKPKEFNIKPYLKSSIWSTLLSYMGYAGYLNPFTLESQINDRIPKLSYITTASHEMAHQFGIASESEANFIAFYTSINHPDPFIQFAGSSLALRYFYSELYKANPILATKNIAKLSPGILKNFKQLSVFWKKFQNPFEPYLKKSYDSYLKANGQTNGIKSYNDMVGLVIAYFEVGEFNLDN